MTVTDDQNFPHDVLVGCETALVLFAAGFHGRQDAYWIKEAGMTATCVDSDPALLEEMKPLYPDDWSFVCDDAYGYALYADKHLSRQWDVVTLDPWTNEFQRCADNLPAWCRIARHSVVLGTGVHTDVTAPAGWRIEAVRKRTDYDGGVFWHLLGRV
jgi:hypothetical protein